MRSARPLLAILPLALAVAACGGDDDDAGACTPELEKRAVAAVLYDAYLFPELLPAAVDPAQFETASELLDAMTAEARRLRWDRGWSYLTTAAAAQAFFEEGKAVGLGLGLAVREGKLRVTQVYGGSPADEAGFARGDTLLRIGETVETLEAVTEANGGELLGPSEEGVTRVLEVLPAGATDPVQRTVTKRAFDLDPVPEVGDVPGQRFRIVERDGRRVGYVALRSFIRTAEPRLEAAFAAFRDAGVTDLVLDLRYNGGGLVSTAALLANLLGGRLAADEVMYRETHNARNAWRDRTYRFAPRASSIAPERIAFVMTGASASASELVANVLEPYLRGSMAVVGSKTYGKPVGQRPFLPLRGCETLAYVVSFRHENADEDGAFFDGLPDAASAFDAPLCVAGDDLEHAQASEEEASTKAAFAFVGSGACPSEPVITSKLALRAAAPPDAYPQAPEPSLAQRHVQGLF
jgi:carboxyl-terminal processing protease